MRIIGLRQGKVTANFFRRSRASDEFGSHDSITEINPSLQAPNAKPYKPKLQLRNSDSRPEGSAEFSCRVPEGAPYFVKTP